MSKQNNKYITRRRAGVDFRNQIPENNELLKGTTGIYIRLSI